MARTRLVLGPLLILAVALGTGSLVFAQSPSEGPEASPGASFALPSFDLCPSPAPSAGLGASPGASVVPLPSEVATASPAASPSLTFDPCASPQAVDVTLADFSVVIAPATVKAGQPITFAVTNRGAEVHELVLEKVGDNDIPLEADGVESEIEDIAAGSSAELVWTITEPGTYQLACHIPGLPGHYEKGMVATFEAVE